jgi:RNA polymerase sigma factor (sigma-70 family)
MANALPRVLRHVRVLATEPASDRTDAELLDAYRIHRDEQAFAALVGRHGPMVLGVCGHVLRQAEDAEDAFQATFLVLARHAASIRKAGSLASWLHGAASRAAMNARRAVQRRRAHEGRVKTMPAKDTITDVSWREVQAVLDAEVDRLAEKHRAAFVLCCLEQKSRAEAARQLGVREGTVSSRLNAAKQQLRERLARRGISLAAVLGTAVLAPTGSRAALSAHLMEATVRAAVGYAAGEARAISPGVGALAEGVAKAMLATRWKLATAVVLAAALAAGASLTAFPAPAPREWGDGPQGERPAEAREAATTTGQPLKPRTDRHGDALPAGALARLGTLRFRHPDMVTCAVFSGDGRTLIVGDQRGTLVFWDVATGKARCLLPAHHSMLQALTISPDGTTAAVASGKDILLWDIAAGRLARTWPTPQNEVRELRFSPDGKSLASRAYDPDICLWDPATGVRRHELKGHRGPVEAFVFSPDGRQLASCSWEDEVVRLWDVATGRETGQLKGHSRPILAVAWSPDGKTIASAGGNDHTLRLWDAVTGKERARTADPDRGAPLPVAYLPDGSALVVRQHLKVCLCDPATGKVRRSFAAPLHSVWKLALSPDGRMLAGAGSGAHLPELWDVATGKLLVPAEGHRQPVQCLVFTSDGRTLFSGGGATEYVLRVWDVRASGSNVGKELRLVGAGRNGCDALALSPDGTLLAVPSGHDLTFEGVALRDPNTDRDVRRLQHPGVIASAHFSADGRRLATCALPYADKKYNRTISLWDVATGRPGEQIDTGPHDDFVRGRAALSPDGRYVAAGGCPGGRVRIWDADTGRKVLEFEAGEHSGEDVAFSPDGRLLAVSGRRGTTGLWEAATGKLLYRLDDPSDRIGALAFSHDGRTLVTGGNAVRLWEVATGRLRATLNGHDGEVCSLAFAPDGRSLASGGADTTILTWDLAGPAARPTHRELEGLWVDLAGDAAAAYRADRTLAAAPEQSTPFLRERVQPVPAPPDRARFARLLADLDSDAFAVRNQAAAELERLGPPVEPLLRQALASSQGPEVRRQLKELLVRLDPIAPDQLRTLRAVEALEHAGGPDAKRLLSELAHGAPGAWLTREAKAALERLARVRRPS